MHLEPWTIKLSFDYVCPKWNRVSVLPFLAMTSLCFVPPKVLTLLCTPASLSTNFHILFLSVNICIGTWLRFLHWQIPYLYNSCSKSSVWMFFSLYLPLNYSVLVRDIKIEIPTLSASLSGSLSLSLNSRGFLAVWKADKEQTSGVIAPPWKRMSQVSCHILDLIHEHSNCQVFQKVSSQW